MRDILLRRLDILKLRALSSTSSRCRNEVVEKMRAKGLVLNKFCYAALIEATGNQRPHPGRDSTGRAVSVSPS
jgi:hypothetical protein